MTFCPIATEPESACVRTDWALDLKRKRTKRRGEHESHDFRGVWGKGRKGSTLAA